MNSRKIIFCAAAAIVLSIAALLYNSLASTTRIGTLNFPDFSVEKLIRSNNNSFIEVESIPLDELDKIDDYDMVLVRVHGSSMSAAHLEAIERAIAKGVAVFSTESDNPKINSLEGQELKYIATLMDNGSVRNNQSMFNYVRKNIDGKKFFNGEYSEPVIVPNDYYFHLGDDNFFATFEEYQKFYEEAENKRLVPVEELGRPRIDVVVQTSGQLRDIAASRLKLINDAVRMAAEAEDDAEANFVSKGFKDAEARLLEKGFSPADARKFSSERIFGGAGGNYGTGIMGMVEDSENWESQDQIAKRYIQNMGALYSANGDEAWGEMRDGVFEAALLNTSVVVQPRSSNTWGPLSLDHVYEFMGGLSAAVQEVTGNDPTAYFNDFRNTSRAKVQGLKEAIGVETNSTIFNPKYITEKMKGEASSYASFAETVRNTFGWNAMKPSAIDEHIWNEYHEIYVRDKHKLGVVEKFSDKNPYAMQELTAVMMESARKGMWEATKEQLAELASLHTKMVIEHEAGCSGFICDNAALREFIAQNAPDTATEYKEAISEAREVKLDEVQADKSVVLKKEEQEQQKKSSAQTEEEKADFSTLYIILGLLALLVAWVIYRKRKK